ncbi:MAG: PIN domain-containing protein [Candidatus Woesearchaeota archaeon]
MTDNILCMIDTNMLIYMFEESYEVRHELANELLEDILNSKVNAAISSQVLSELFVNLTSGNKKIVAAPLSISTAKMIIADIAKTGRFKVFGVEPSTVLEAIKLKEDSGAPYWDCLIAAIMREHGMSKIYTEDDGFRKIGWIEVINPFSGINAQPT